MDTIKMNSRPTQIILLLVAVCMYGCDRQSAETTVTAETQSTTATHRPTGRTYSPIDDISPLTEDALRDIETKYSCQLPGDYREFLLENNGGFPSPDCAKFEEDGRKTTSDIFCFFAVDDRHAWASMDWHYETYSGRLPRETIPIARDSCGNLWLLSIGGEQAGSVFFWDHGSYDTFDETDLSNWPRVAASFQEFRDSLRPFDGSAEDSAMPSRYALVKQAADAMAGNDAASNTRANPGFVWHCDCDDDGSVTMQFVNYDVHAMITHTDGYSRLRAIKGWIKGGQTRLPD